MMALDGKPIESINENFLQGLVDNKVPEGRTIEYKQNRPATTDSEKKKYLIQISSFANATGGHLIYGMKEENGIPIEILGLDIDDSDAEILRLDNIVRYGIDPRIWGINIYIVPLQTSKKAIIIRVPKSYNPPHMVIFGGERRFYSRGSAGKYPLDVGELRTLLGLSDTVAKRIRDFRAERLSRICADITPIPLTQGLKIVLHMLPFDSFSLGKNYDLSSFDEDPSRLPNIGWKVHDGRRNLDGYVSCHGYIEGRRAEGTYSYTQVFLNGIIEAVWTEYSHSENNSGEDRSLNIAYEDQLVTYLTNILATQKGIGIVPPIFLMLTFLGVKGYRLTRGSHPLNIDLPCYPFDNDSLVMPEVRIESFDCDLNEKMRFVFDLVRNAAGLEPKYQRK